MARSLRNVLSLLPLGLVLCQAGPAGAGGLRFDPVYLHLKRDAPTTLLKLANTGATAMRYQITAFAWSQGPQGEMQLKPTKEILFFPVVFTLQPNEGRIVRLGTTAPFAAFEKTYRIFIDEFESEGQRPKGGPAVSIRTRVGLPVFLDPPDPVASLRVDAVTVSGGQLSVRLKSTGNAHVLMQGVEARAVGSGETSVYEHKWGPGYLLTGNELRLSAPLPRERCSQVKAVKIRVLTAKGPIEETARIAPGACAS